jgi:hypothetical protein
MTNQTNSASHRVENWRQPLGEEKAVGSLVYGIALSDGWGQWVGRTGQFTANNDADAIRQASSLSISELNVEVWDGMFNRMISRLPAI